MAGTIQIEVAYVGPEGQWLIALEVPLGTTAIEAVRRSGIAASLPDTLLSAPRLGIYSHPIALDTHLHAGDRVEIYRPLQADPKSARRARAERTKRR
jgi:putative ubiquitin-RnfH superfamily antitoxin RatB of RatAB toxin-antitoxin module